MHSGITLVSTPAIGFTLRMARAVMRSRSSGAIGVIAGPPGVGKTMAGRALIEKMGAIRVCSHVGISTRLLIARIHDALGLPQTTGGAATLVAKMESAIRGKLLVVDEANTLTWRELEILRFCSDEMGVGLVLVGTELLDRPFKDGRTGILLAQFSSRVGTKRLDLKPFDDPSQTAEFVIAPMLGSVSQSVAERFHAGTRGYWRDGVELATACQRIMTNRGEKQLTASVLDAATAMMARRFGKAKALRIAGDKA